MRQKYKKKRSEFEELGHEFDDDLDEWGIKNDDEWGF